jgi:DNA-directed RNA polymerase subunit K/omega
MNTITATQRVLSKYEIVVQAATMAREALKYNPVMRIGLDPYNEGVKQDKEIVNALKTVYHLNEKLQKVSLT